MTATKKTDTLFEPSVEMMVNDFDDERTLEEEEALAATEAEDPSTELTTLQREGDMPIEELLAMYGTSENVAAATAIDSVALAQKPNGIVIPTELERPASSSSHNSIEIDSEPDEEPTSTTVKDESSDLHSMFVHADQRHLRTLLRPLQSEEEEDCDEYNSPDEEDDFKKTIMVGSEFQAVIPEGLCKYGDALPYENEDKLVWDPSKLRETDVVQYEQKSSLLTAQSSAAAAAAAVATESTEQDATTGASSTTETGEGAVPSMPESATALIAATIPIGNHLRDDEQTLYLLLQCGHNVEEALRRRRINSASSSNTEMSQWSEEECRNFENGLRIYGKDFHTIQQSKVRTRSVGELVQFYYLWKKTERHDVFANKARLEKKKYSLHPGLTDYMDRFLEEQECNGGSSGGIVASGSGSQQHGGGGGGGGSGDGGSSNGTRERSSSPGVNCLLYTQKSRLY